ncbi:hypothetical protein GOBAR_AA06834 [Gossypium barbadense]|uniref:Uncharacterized protein n=1 Tax=Gossypium barbadense TaxID=3634 RepID=A0A2P5YDS0_GOSBA|nr:hypothetical protein GOBAR_AA06834 [Gossypium barbadense]
MLSMRMIERRRGTHPPQYRLTQSTEEEAYKDIPDDVPLQHKDPPTQPPPLSRPVHAAASYANISECLTRFEQQCLQRFDNIDATLQTYGLMNLYNCRNILLHSQTDYSPKLQFEEFIIQEEISSKNLHEPCSSNNKGPIYEEQRLQIEKLDEWRIQKLRTPDKPNRAKTSSIHHQINLRLETKRKTRSCLETVVDTVKLTQAWAIIHGRGRSG